MYTQIKIYIYISMYLSLYLHAYTYIELEIDRYLSQVNSRSTHTCHPPSPASRRYM